ENLGKSTGRGADIKADSILRIKTKMIERRRQLNATPRYVRMRRACKQRGVRRNFLRGLAHYPFVGGHKASFNRGLCLGAAFKQAALDQQAIDALARRIHKLNPCSKPEPDSGTKLCSPWLPAIGPIAIARALAISV